MIYRSKVSKNGLYLELKLHQLWRTALWLSQDCWLSNDYLVITYELRLFCYCYFLIGQDHGFGSPLQLHQLGVSFVLRCFYKSNSCCLCRDENGKRFCLAELWPCTTSNPTFWGFELKLQTFNLVVLPFRRIKKTNLQSLHWPFGFIEISSFTPSTRSKIQKKNFFGFTHASSKNHFRSTEDHTFYWSIMTADDIIKYVGGRTQTWQAKWAVFKILGFDCKRFLPLSPPLPRSFTCAIFARCLTLVPRSLLLNRTETLA